jgi:hypothetical protein
MLCDSIHIAAVLCVRNAVLCIWNYFVAVLYISCQELLNGSVGYQVLCVVYPYLFATPYFISGVNSWLCCTFETLRCLLTMASWPYCLSQTLSCNSETS